MRASRLSLRCINGLVPHFSGGTLMGRVVVGGRDTRVHRPRDLADLVGFVAQDPVSARHGRGGGRLRDGRRWASTPPPCAGGWRRPSTSWGCPTCGIVPLKDLSGGQQQRVAIGAVLAAGPRILVLDEPTSALDPVAAEDVLATLHRLVHDLGITVVVAEHRLERVIHHADPGAVA